MNEPTQRAVYVALQTLLLPATLLGYVLLVIGLARGKRAMPGVSATILASLTARVAMHELGVRDDEPACRLMANMPNVSLLGWKLQMAAIKASRALTGYVPKVYLYPYGEATAPFAHQPSARTTYYDSALERHLPSVDNLVILGAGFDTRALRRPLTREVRVFEVDAPLTQTYKQQTLARAGLDSTGITYVSADFEREDWLERLREAGFDASKRTLVLWESVCMYLRRESVEKTLRQIGTLAPGSVLAFDYLSSDSLAPSSLAGRYTMEALKRGGEPWTFGLDTTPPIWDRVVELLEPYGLTLLEHRRFAPAEGEERTDGGFAIALAG